MLQSFRLWDTPNKTDPNVSNELYHKMENSRPEPRTKEERDDPYMKKQGKARIYGRQAVLLRLRARTDVDSKEVP